MEEQQTKKTYAVKSDNGVVSVINGKSCSTGYCSEFGCDFPNCATFSGEHFNTEYDALKKYPDLEIV